MVNNAGQLQRTTGSSGIHAGQWEEPEFEFDDLGVDLASAAQHSSGKMTDTHQQC